MKRNTILILLITLSIIGCIGTNNSITGDETDMSISEDKSTEKTEEPEGVEGLEGWEKIQVLEEKGLTRSILDELDRMYIKAKAGQQQDELVKIIIYQMKYESYITEEANVEVIKRITQEIEEASGPVKSILYSILAEFYWQYYENNRYTFSERTETVGLENGDITTWDIKKLVSEISSLYRASISEKEILKKIDIKTYDKILIKGNSRDLRPTLYDFLAHRALDFFSNEEAYITRPAYKFELNDEALFGPAEKFSRLKLSTRDTTSLKFHSLLIYQDLLDFHSKDKNPAAFVRTDLKRLSFVKNHAVELDEDGLYLKALELLDKKYKTHKVSGIVSYKIADHYFQQASLYKPGVFDEYKWYKKKADDICEMVITTFPGTEGAMYCRALKDSIREKTLTFSIEKANVPNIPFRMLVSFKNIRNAYFKIIRLSEIQRETADNIEYNEGTEVKIDYYNSLETEKIFDAAFPFDGDFQEHAAEIRIPALKAGYYIILASALKDFSKDNNAVFYSPVWITNISFIMSEDWQDGKKTFYVTDRETGEPLAGVKARILIRKYNYNTYRYKIRSGELYKTDDNGLFTIKPHKSRDFLIKLMYNDEVCLFDNQYYQSQPYQYSDNPSRTIFFTDRVMYRPGQTIYYKGIVLKNLNKYGDKKRIEQNYKTTIYFYDVNSQVISQTDVTTNEYGTFNGTFTAPTDRLNGNMSITNESGSCSFSVEEYKRPKFEVKFEPVKGSFKAREKVTVAGTAKAYSGFPIDSADVRYRIVRNVSYPYWYWYWGPYPATPAIEIKNGVMKADEKGGFQIDFIALPDLTIPEDKLPVFDYTVYADVTDINGETHSSQVSVRVGYVALSLTLDIPEKLNKDKDYEFTIQSYNLNNVFEPARGTIQIFQLISPDKTFRERLWKKPDTFILKKEEYTASFPNDVYYDENEYHTWKREKSIATIKFNTEKEKKYILSNMDQWNQGKYLFELTTKDNFGKEIRVEKYFTLYSNKEKKLPIPEIVWYQPVKTICQPGETASVEIGTSERNVHVIYEIFHKDSIVQTSHLRISEERKTVEFPVEEKHRGNFTIHINIIRHNRTYIFSQPVYVDWRNKQLNIEFETFRDKLLPGEHEEWRLKLTGSEGEKVGAEMVATLYDASLDSFREHHWYTGMYPYFYSYRNWQDNYSFTTLSSYSYNWNFNEYANVTNRYFDRINYYGFSFANLYYKKNRILEKSMMDGEMDDEIMPVMSAEDNAPGEPEPKVKREDMKEKKDKDITTGRTETVTSENGPGEVQIRTNLNETAFFYPELRTDQDGRIIISFTIPEALTRWKMLGFAHTKNIEYGYVENELVTQKDLMIIPNAPRFFRENDTITFTAKVTNLSEKDLSGTATIELYDAVTMQPVDAIFENTHNSRQFIAEKEKSAAVEWDLHIPENIQAVTYRVIAKADTFSDGEEMVIPVLTNRMLVTESLPLPVRGKETKKFTFSKLLESGKSPTLTHQRITLEFTSNPAWYAIQALPYIMEYPYECSEQVFSRFYANSISTHIVNSDPGIKKVFDSWKGTKALSSNLEKNEELKTLLLEETPWVLQAQNESERKKRIALLFDLKKMNKELGKAMKKIIDMQASNGGWPWFAGLPDNRYITQHITAGMGHLDKLKIKSVRDDSRLWNMITRAVGYIDVQMQKDYDYLINNNIKLNENNLGYLTIHYLYTRSFFSDIAIKEAHKKAFDYWISQADTYWLDFSRYLQGMISLALFRYDNKTGAYKIIESLKENALYSNEMGMYWKSNQPGYYWYQAPVETQSLLIEAFGEVSGDRKSVEEMKIWLLKQKQTQDWKTTKATADACYALLLEGTNLLQSRELVEISLGNLKIDPETMEDVKIEAGTGYFKTSWGRDMINPDMGNIIVTKKDEGAAWGALYWQYFEQLDKITPHETPLKLKKMLFLQTDTDTGPVIKQITDKTALQPGDLLKVRIELKVDRDMEYLHMKDMRASGLEPTHVFSGYRYQDGLWYYESTKDASTNFFFPWITKGTYVFEYPLRVTHEGDFSNGIATIQCMYAPEFTSHSEGIRIRIKGR